MKTILMAALFAIASGFLFAADTSVFQLRLVAEAPTKTTEVYSLPMHDGTTEKLNLETAILLDHTSLKSIKGSKDGNGKPIIVITLTTAGAKRFGEITEQHKGKQLGIIVLNKLLLAPVIRDAIYGGSLEITGNFTGQEAAEIAAKVTEHL